MQTQWTRRENETSDSTPCLRKAAAEMHPAGLQSRHRPARVSLPLPRRETCFTRRAMLAALREAELDEWLKTGGDYLNSMHQPAD